jgi:hypothetical protein
MKRIFIPLVILLGFLYSVSSELYFTVDPATGGIVDVQLIKLKGTPIGSLISNDLTVFSKPVSVAFDSLKLDARLALAPIIYAVKYPLLSVSMIALGAIFNGRISARSKS